MRVNERRYEFGDTDGADDWVCAKIPNDGRIKKDCVPRREAPGWFVHLLDNRDFKVRPGQVGYNDSSLQGCNGGVCFCDDRDACNLSTKLAITKYSTNTQEFSSFI